MRSRVQSAGVGNAELLLGPLVLVPSGTATIAPHRSSDEAKDGQAFTDVVKKAREALCGLRAHFAGFRDSLGAVRAPAAASFNDAPPAKIGSVKPVFSKWRLGIAASAMLAVAAIVWSQWNAYLIPSVRNADLAVEPANPKPQTAEALPPVGTRLQFTQANLRYCTYQQVRLEAVRPLTDGDELAFFNALITDWNSRCARYLYSPSDKEVVDSEIIGRREQLEAEGRALMSRWRGKTQTTIQSLPINSQPIPASTIIDGVASASPQGTRMAGAAEPLPSIITLGVSTGAQRDPDIVLPLQSPSLDLLRADAAMRIQKRLNDLGYVIKPTDGTWGPVSRAALRRFKEANGLLWNDAFDAETATRLFAISAMPALPAAMDQSDETQGAVETAYPPPPGAETNPLNRGDCLKIQRRLAALGYYAGSGDGLWGAASRSALRHFKAANGLGEDDVWDAAAEAAMHDPRAIVASETFVGRWPREAPSCQPRANELEEGPINIGAVRLGDGKTLCETSDVRRTAAVVSSALASEIAAPPLPKPSPRIAGPSKPVEPVASRTTHDVVRPPATIPVR